MLARRMDRLCVADFTCRSLYMRILYQKHKQRGRAIYVFKQLDGDHDALDSRQMYFHLSCRDDGTHASGIVDEFKKVGFLRRICVVNDKPRDDLPTFRVKHVACVRTADAPPPRDHLPPVAVVTEQFDNTFHAHLASTVVFPVIVSACGQAQCRFQLANTAALLVLA